MSCQFREDQRTNTLDLHDYLSPHCAVLAPHGLDPSTHQSVSGDIDGIKTGLPFRSEPIYGVVDA